MQIKRIAPEDLAGIFPFNHSKSGEFVVMVDNRKDILYVNHTVPQKDIDGFLEVVTFPDDAVADGYSKTGKLLEHIYERYGFGVCSILLDSHEERRKQEKRIRAKEAAKHILPLIEKEVNSENPIVEYDEFLAYEIWQAGFALDRHTARHISNYGSVYEFYLGYLMGAGILKGGVM